MTASSDDTRACPFCREEVKIAATRCRHCHADIPAGWDGRARLPLVQGRQIRAVTHREQLTPAADANRKPSSACNHIEIDVDGGIWEYIGEDADHCYYWGPA